MPLSRRQFVAASLLTTVGSARAADARLVVLQPLGNGVQGRELEAVAAAISAFYAVQLEWRAPLALPKTAFYPARSRYRAEKLLDYLVAHGSPAARVTLGLTAADISTTKGGYADWGILGLATLDGHSAVLSSFRCRRGAKSREHARVRFAKTAVHELGHSFGLDHCREPGCIMHDGEGSVLTTDTEHDLCELTRTRLREAGMLRTGARSPFAP